ncbi:MAG: hypothetical protein IAE83_03215 [Anaerolinea sp.]|nr:hypothetical protein [Anaerolinea sp.]MCC6975279.1 hypothetical protein [Anaerolineae bacterium]
MTEYPNDSSTPSRPFPIRPWMVVACVVAIYLSLVYFWNDQKVMEFVFPRQIGEGIGYDGQFTYFIARDPLGAAALIKERLDYPAYRYQRILHPILTRILSLGYEPVMPWVMLLIDYLMIVIGVAALEVLLTDLGVSRWHALTYGFFGGIVAAARATTTEPLAFGLVIVAILAGMKGRIRWQAILFGLAALAKEPTLFFAAAFVLYYLTQKRYRDALWVGAASLIPFLIWQLVLWLWLGEVAMGSGGAGATGFEIIPFGGVWRIGVESPPVFAYMFPYLALGAILPTLLALILSGRDLLMGKAHPYVWCVLLNAAVIPTVPFSTFREPFGIIRFLPGLVLSFLLYAALWVKWERPRRPLVYASIWVIWSLVLIG